jgi:hypothetical protein
VGVKAAALKEQDMNFSDIELPSNRKFGIFFSLIFTLIGLYLLNLELMNLAFSFFSLAGLFFIVSLIKSDLLFPLNKIWMKIGLLIGSIISPIVLGAIFFLIFTPISLLMKIIGRDELRLKIKKNQSHWIQKKTNATEIESFKNQF